MTTATGRGRLQLGQIRSERIIDALQPDRGQGADGAIVAVLPFCKAVDRGDDREKARVEEIARQRRSVNRDLQIVEAYDVAAHARGILQLPSTVTASANFVPSSSVD